MPDEFNHLSFSCRFQGLRGGINFLRYVVVLESKTGLWIMTDICRSELK